MTTAAAALSTTLLAMAQSLREQADCREAAAASRDLAADRAVAAEILAIAGQATDLSPEALRRLAQLAEDAERGEMGPHQDLLQWWGHDCQSSYGRGDGCYEILEQRPLLRARRERESAEARARQEALLEALRGDPTLVVWCGAGSWYAGRRSSCGGKSVVGSCAAHRLEPEERALLEGRAAATEAEDRALREAEAAARAAEEAARDADYAALLRALHPDLPAGAAAEVDRHSIRAAVLESVAGRLDRMPTARSEGEVRARISIDGYRALQALRERVLVGARTLAEEAGIGAGTVDLAVDRYEWRWESQDGEVIRKAWTADLDLRIGRVSLPMREVVLDARG